MADSSQASDLLKAHKRPAKSCVTYDFPAWEVESCSRPVRATAAQNEECQSQAVASDWPVYESFCKGRPDSCCRMSEAKVSGVGWPVTFDFAGSHAACARNCGVVARSPSWAACHAALTPTSSTVPAGLAAGDRCLQRSAAAHSGSHQGYRGYQAEWPCAPLAGVKPRAGSEPPLSGAHSGSMLNQC